LSPYWYISGLISVGEEYNPPVFQTSIFGTEIEWKTKNPIISNPIALSPYLCDAGLEIEAREQINGLIICVNGVMTVRDMY
jgi:hypothetical protein